MYFMFELIVNFFKYVLVGKTCCQEQPETLDWFSIETIKAGYERWGDSNTFSEDSVHHNDVVVEFWSILAVSAL